MSYTKGPWKIERKSRGWSFGAVVVDSKSRHVAWPWDTKNHNHCESEETLANAALISASPEMLEVLLLIRERLHDEDDVWKYETTLEKIDEVINKAKGTL